MSIYQVNLNPHDTEYDRRSLSSLPLNLSGNSKYSFSARKNLDDAKIIDLTSDTETPYEISLRRSKSQQVKSDSKATKLSKYLQKHRASLACTPSREQGLEVCSKNHKMSLQNDYLLSCPPSLNYGSCSFDKQSQSSEEQGLAAFNSISMRKRKSTPEANTGSWRNNKEPQDCNLSDSTFDSFVDEDESLEDVKKYISEVSLKYAETYDYFCKVVLLGDPGVGKTCLLMKFKDGTFLSGMYISTVGLDFRNKVVNVDGSKVKLQIWDTAGQERFRSVTHAYYRDAHALLLLYDVSSKTSFDNTRAWLAEVHEYAQDDVVIMLIGNKCDIAGTVREIRKEDGERLAKEYNVAFMETSAKTGLNVELAFTAIARDLKSRKSGMVTDKKFNVVEYVNNTSSIDQCGCSGVKRGGLRAPK